MKVCDLFNMFGSPEVNENVIIISCLELVKATN